MMISACYGMSHSKAGSYASLSAHHPSASLLHLEHGKGTVLTHRLRNCCGEPKTKPENDSPSLQVAINIRKVGPIRQREFFQFFY